MDVSKTVCIAKVCADILPIITPVHGVGLPGMPGVSRSMPSYSISSRTACCFESSLVQMGYGSESLE